MSAIDVRASTADLLFAGAGVCLMDLIMGWLGLAEDEVPGVNLVLSCFSCGVFSEDRDPATVCRIVMVGRPDVDEGEPSTPFPIESVDEGLALRC
jgi:hypothetical protein